MKKLLLPLVVGMLVLSGCANKPSSDASSGDPTQAVLDAFAKTTAAGSARMALELSITSPQRSVKVTGQAEYQMTPGDLTKVSEHVTLQIPSLAPGMPAGEVELIVVDGPVLYAKVPMLAGFLGATTPWVKIDPSELPNGGAGFGAAAGAMQPAAALALIQDALTVEQAGSDTIDGVDATRYRVTLDLVKVLPKLAELSPTSGHQITDADLAKIEAGLTKAGMRELPMDVWVDGDGYVKQLQLSVDTSKIEGNDSGMQLALTVTFSDVGGTFSIEAPPASQVTDINELSPMMGATTTVKTH
jgi:hypothetical protein